MNQKQLRALIKKLRKEKCWTQNDLAIKLNTQRPAISRLENQEQDLRLSTLCSIAKAFKKKLVINFE